ncbi:MAG: DUF3667 domain-containing protein [Dokdonella sp.]
MSSEIELPPLPPPAPAPKSALADAEFSEAVADTPVHACPNCGAPAHGPYCYACGQSEKGMIRHLSEVMSEFADIVFNVDSRIFRSLWDLYVRPGYLTSEYLAGRRARYVTPFRLFFFLSIVAFFSMQMALPDTSKLNFSVFNSIENAKTPDEINFAVDKEIKALTAQMNQSGNSEKTKSENEEKIKKVRKSGADRLQVLKRQIDDAIASSAANDAQGKSLPAALPLTYAQPARLDAARAGLKNTAVVPNENHEKGFTFLSDHWIEEHPVHVAWFPDRLNASLTRLLLHMQKNAESANADPGRLLAGFFSVLPQTLFVVMPLFAVLLKIFYLFKRRLYMEHLLVALHSHAFIFVSILVILGLSLLADLAGDRIWLTQPLGWLQAMAWIWLFVYLFLMQKRIYRQGWIMTAMKYGLVGFSYSFILSFALVFAGLISLALT